MVLERIYSTAWIESKPLAAYVLGLAYSIFGIFFALFLFPQDPAIVAVAITSILLIPTIGLIINKDEMADAVIRKTNIIQILNSHKSLFLVYVFSFLGILTSFTIFSTFLPSIAANHFFKSQLSVLYGSIGKATFTTPLFTDILMNNFKVLAFCFLAALIIGDSGMFIITWNASVWGTIFGNLASTAASHAGKNPFIYLLLVLISVFPHMIVEATSYFVAASSGGIMSNGIMDKPKNLGRIIHVAAILLILSVIVLALGALIETFVLDNVEVYRIIILQSLSK